jgi:hypothetical protein
MHNVMAIFLFLLSRVTCSVYGYLIVLALGSTSLGMASQQTHKFTVEIRPTQIAPVHSVPFCVFCAFLRLKLRGNPRVFRPLTFFQFSRVWAALRAVGNVLSRGFFSLNLGTDQSPLFGVT